MGPFVNFVSRLLMFSLFRHFGPKFGVKLSYEIFYCSLLKLLLQFNSDYLGSPYTVRSLRFFGIGGSHIGVRPSKIIVVRPNIGLEISGQEISDIACIFLRLSKAGFCFPLFTSDVGIIGFPLKMFPSRGNIFSFRGKCVHDCVIVEKYSDRSELLRVKPEERNSMRRYYYVLWSLCLDTCSSPVKW